jgi:hypothetical protein
MCSIDLRYIGGAMDEYLQRRARCSSVIFFTLAGSTSTSSIGKYDPLRISSVGNDGYLFI